ncbi:zinc ribbon domain-containing protein [Methanosphaerula subterraneus]|uniref:zinc ribbon domain-containing protein n=1 Tax=Methanosphaerula subterraneus TaxID=3350244 RepID=UPI003F8708B3
MKKCPNCGTQARDEWTLCPSCGIDLRKAAGILGRDYYVPLESEPVFTGTAGPAQQGMIVPPLVAAVPARPVPVPGYSSNVWLILLLFGTILAAIVWAPLAWICVVLSGIAVHVDAKYLHAGNYQKETFSSVTWNPFSWALLVFIWWFVGMPFYLYRRRLIWETYRDDIR